MAAAVDSQWCARINMQTRAQVSQVVLAACWPFPQAVLHLRTLWSDDTRAILTARFKVWLSYACCKLLALCYRHITGMKQREWNQPRRRRAPINHSHEVSCQFILFSSHLQPLRKSWFYICPPCSFCGYLFFLWTFNAIDFVAHIESVKTDKARGWPSFWRHIVFPGRR